MAVTRFYSSVAPLMTLQSALSASATAVLVDTTAGLPASTPFTICIDEDQVNQELCDVTNVAGSTLTVVRGVDGTVGIAHDPGALITHDHSARDDRDSREHEAASSGIHGVAGDLVGTTDTQALTNKTINGSSNTLTNIPGSQVIGAASVAKSVLPTDTVYLATAQTLTNKTITAPLGIVKADVGLGNVDNTSNATERAAVATLANKSISGSANTLTNIPDSALVALIGSKLTGANSVAKAVLPSDTAYTTDTGNLTGSAAIVSATGWADTSTRLRVKNGVATLDVALTRTGATITAGANGSIADSVMGTLAAAQSANWPTGNSKFGMGSHLATTATVRVSNAGDVVVAATFPNGDITNGDTITGTVTWLV